MAAYDYDGTNEVIALCPTRDNPAGALAMVQSFYDTIERVGTEVILVVDEDDPQLEAYLAIPQQVVYRRTYPGIMRADPPRIIILRMEETGSLTAATNSAVQRLWGTDCIIGHVGDDHLFKTKGWDTQIRAKLLADGPGVAYAFDGHKSAWASSWFTSSIIIRTLGWLAVPGSMHLAIDDVYMDIGAALGRLFYMDDILIAHKTDAVAASRAFVKQHYSISKRARESENYARYLRDDFDADIAKLRQVLGLPDEPYDALPGMSPGQTFRKRQYVKAAQEKVKAQHRWIRAETKLWT